MPASGNESTLHSQQQTPPDLDAEVSRQCLEITEQFRTGVISKIAAVLRLQNVIPKSGGTNTEEAASVAALGSYLSILDGYERVRASAAAGGRIAAEGFDARTGSVDRGDRDASPEGSQPSTFARPPKRPHTSHSDSEDEGEGSNKRKINMAELPWVTYEALGIFTPLSPSLSKTRSILENISLDIKTAKASLLLTPHLPQFPDSEWNNLLHGRAIDLDHVLAGMYSINHDERRTERLGQLEVVIGGTKPARVVETHGQWVIAWGQLVEATLVVFPHRAAELSDYGKHVNQLFSSFAEGLHGNVIKYDRAVRIHIGQRRDLSLTDYQQFTDLHVLWIQGAGAGAHSNTSKRTANVGPKPRRRDPCRRFNDGKCPNSAASCNYAHVCSRCRRTGHAVDACAQPK